MKPLQWTERGVGFRGFGLLGSCVNGRLCIPTWLTSSQRLWHMDVGQFSPCPSVHRPHLRLPEPFCRMLTSLFTVPVERAICNWLSKTHRTLCVQASVFERRVSDDTRFCCSAQCAGSVPLGSSFLSLPPGVRNTRRVE